ncbi:MAG: M20 family metallopeptidase [Candidatus Omnitrophica bacterium]|nr:M20 family metallopeptidase [Candidatus Omnitrophota bacterium]
MINKKRLIKLTRSLIRINSENPPGNEARMAVFVKNYLENLGLRPKIHEFKKRRSNVMAVLKGKNTKRSLLITPHLDTVPAGKNWHFGPFTGKIYQGKIYGLGATDCKGNLACALEVINSIIEDRAILDYNLVFAATADEESGSGLGLIPLLNKKIIKPDAAVILDSDDFSIIITQKGLIHLKVGIQGKKAHGAYPWRGINAIDIALNILKEIKAYKFVTPVCRGSGCAYRKYLKPSTVNIGTIKGGDKVNVVADWCEFELDFRFLPGESAKEILKDIRGIIRKHTKNFKIEIEGIQKPYWINESHRLVEYLTRSMRKMRISSKIKGSEGATVISFFQDKGIPAIATGFGCEGCCHVADEYVKIDNLYKGSKVLEEFLKNYKPPR